MSADFLLIQEAKKVHRMTEDQGNGNITTTGIRFDKLEQSKHFMPQSCNIVGGLYLDLK